jgi:hypothetical protein
LAEKITVVVRGEFYWFCWVFGGVGGFGRGFLLVSLWWVVVSWWRFAAGFVEGVWCDRFLGFILG